MGIACNFFCLSINDWGRRDTTNLYEVQIENEVALVRSGLGGTYCCRATTLDEAKALALAYWKKMQTSGIRFYLEEVEGADLQENFFQRYKTVEISYWSDQMRHGFADAVSASGMASRYVHQNPVRQGPVEHTSSDWTNTDPGNLKVSSVRLLEYEVK